LFFVLSSLVESHGLKSGELCLSVRNFFVAKVVRAE